MKRFMSAVLIGVAAASLAPPASAQKKEKDLTPLQQMDLDKKKEHEAVDKQYQRAVQGTTGVAAVKIDPWANMRAPSDSTSKK